MESDIIPDLSKLSNIKVWEAAAVQIFFSLSGIQFSQNLLIILIGLLQISSNTFYFEANFLNIACARCRKIKHKIEK